MSPREKLVAKQAVYRQALRQCELRVLQKESELRDAREARAAALGGLGVIDEQLAELDEPPAEKK